MAVKGSLTFDLVTVRFQGTDFYGNKFDIHLDPEDAKNLIFRLHRIVRMQAEARLEVNATHDGGKVA